MKEEMLAEGGQWTLRPQKKCGQVRVFKVLGWPSKRPGVAMTRRKMV